MSTFGCPHAKRLSMGALAEEKEPGVLVGDPRRRGLGLLCAKPLHRAGKYKMFVILIIKKEKRNLLLLRGHAYLHLVYSLG